MSANQDRAGIYKVTIGPYFYIGSTAKFSKRRYAHLFLLKKGSHHNRALQKAYFELRTFSFQVLEVVPDGESLFPLEQRYIDAANGSEFMCNVGNPDGRYMSDEEFDRLRVTTPGRYSRSDEAKKRISESKKGAANPQSKPVIVTHPDGKEVEFPSQTSAANFFGVSQQALQQWMTGKIAWPGDTAKVGKEWIWRFRARFKDGAGPIIQASHLGAQDPA